MCIHPAAVDILKTLQTGHLCPHVYVLGTGKKFPLIYKNRNFYINEQWKKIVVKLVELKLQLLENRRSAHRELFGFGLHSQSTQVQCCRHNTFVQVIIHDFIIHQRHLYLTFLK